MFDRIGKNFCVLDLVFFLGYMVVTLAIGFWVGRREKATVGDYFRAGNRLPWYAIGCSIIAAGISSEQFVGETGYAYQFGMPVVNWEWLIFPALSIFLWIFVPLYVRNNVATMPEYLERRFGPRSRTLYASLIITSYVLANFALVFYTAGFAMEQMWGVNRFVAIAIIAITTGAYTIYGGLESVAWTDFFQCILLLGGGVYVFFAGMAHPRVGWDFSKLLADPDRAHLMGGGKDFPWAGWIILALSTNTWYYATDQFINQRCLGARSEWHSKMGVLLAGGIQIIMPLATCFPGMLYYVINPHLAQADQAYPSMVREVVPAGLRGLVVAAVLGAIMSTVSGLVNSTSTLFTLDILRRTKGRDWSEMKLVRWGQLSGTIALVLGAAFSVAVMNWQNMFRYCQDIWAPMAAPAVVVFLGGALWKGARERGATVCLWLSVLTVPITFLKQILADRGIHFLPPSLENSMVFAGLVYMAAIALLICLSLNTAHWKRILYSAISITALSLLATKSTEAVAAMVAVSVIGAILVFCFRARVPQANMWDRSMLREPGVSAKWYQSLWTWWLVLGTILVAIYINFW
jgi:solute:Na+ symporter, SSS family